MEQGKGYASEEERTENSAEKNKSLDQVKTIPSNVPPPDDNGSSKSMSIEELYKII